MKFLTISKCWTGLECGWDWSGDLAKTKRLSMQTEGLVVMPHPLGPGTPTPGSSLEPQECHHRSTHFLCTLSSLMRTQKGHPGRSPIAPG
jgi:hypothetical protein